MFFSLMKIDAVVLDARMKAFFWVCAIRTTAKVIALTWTFLLIKSLPLKIDHEKDMFSG